MKRKLYSESNAIYTAPPLESTLLVDTGGLYYDNPVGKFPSTNISAAVSSGTRLFQYNRFFWQNDLFTYNYSNGSIGVAIAYYRASTQRYSLVVYPITLPRTAMSLVSSLQNLPTEDPTQRSLLLDQLVYYLNIGWTSYGVGNQNVPTQVPGCTSGPLVLAKNCKGWLLTQTLNNPDFPLFTDTSPPPLVWSKLPNNQLALQYNPAYWLQGHAAPGGDGVLS